MDKILLLQNPHWGGVKYSFEYQRLILDTLIHQLDIPEIQIIQGVRRSGKSSLLKMLINHLLSKTKPQSILYVNIEDPFFINIWSDPKELYSIIEAAEKLTSHPCEYLFLDEIQNVDGWETFVKSIYETGRYKKIIITGSNSKLLEDDYATLLSGRYISDRIYPLSFKELVMNMGISTPLDLVKHKPRVLKQQDDVLFYGCYPAVLRANRQEEKRKLLLAYYESILMRDCVAQNKIRDIRLLEELSHYILTNTAVPFSYNSLAKALDSNENTIKSFLTKLGDAFLIDVLDNFAFSLKKQTKSKKKAYCIDNGLIYSVGFKFMVNQGKLLENLVYTELVKTNEEVYHYNELKECDFIVKNGNELTAIQVTYELNSGNMQREIQGLKNALKKTDANTGYIITYNTEKVLEDGTLVIPFWKYFSGVGQI